MTRKLTAPRLLIVADLEYAGGEQRLLGWLDVLAEVAADPRVAIQLRAKSLDSTALDELAGAVRDRMPAGTRLLLNGSPEIATRLGVAGVHWPESTVPSTLPAQPRWHSAAVHSLDALRRAQAAGVDAVVFGAVWAPGSHPGEAAGLEALREVCAGAAVPVIAIGGITPARVAACIEAGAHGVGVISGVLGAEDPAAATRAYLDALDTALAARTSEVTQ
jgi:thiamine-phosphate diphosphorylase